MFVAKQDAQHVVHVLKNVPPATHVNIVVVVGETTTAAVADQVDALVVGTTPTAAHVQENVVSVAQYADFADQNLYAVGKTTQ